MAQQERESTRVRSMRLDLATDARLAELAAAEGQSVTAWIRGLVEQRAEELSAGVGARRWLDRNTTIGSQLGNRGAPLWPFDSNTAGELRDQFDGFMRALSDLLTRLHARSPEAAQDAADELAESVRVWLANHADDGTKR